MTALSCDCAHTGSLRACIAGEYTWLLYVLMEEEDYVYVCTDFYNDDADNVEVDLCV